LCQLPLSITFDHDDHVLAVDDIRNRGRKLPTYRK